MAEILFALVGLIALISGFQLIGASFILLCSCLIFFRAYKLRGAAKRLGALEQTNPLMKILVFEYFTKWAGLKGYAFGYIHGPKTCRDCRSRLKND
jgi:CDP-diglyceride synthetase